MSPSNICFYDDPVQVIAANTLHLVRLLVSDVNVLASVAIEILFFQLVVFHFGHVSSVATLMHRCIAPITNQNFIPFFVMLSKANVALDIVILIVLGDPQALVDTLLGVHWRDYELLHLVFCNHTQITGRNYL